MQDDLSLWTARRIAEGVRKRDVTATAVVERVLQRIAEVDPLIRAYASVDTEGALAAAQRLDAQIGRGEAVGPLAGVSFSVKDLVPTQGVETAYGSYALAGNVPAQDAEAVARLKRAGAILIGKTTTPEFGHKALTSSPRYGHTRNPWSFDRSPGGSSGGGTAAVAAGLAPLALTTDGSGSARIPAAVCGVLGLKPTLGRIPNESAVELFSNFICLGLSTRSADDLALALQATAGPHAGDPWSRGTSGQSFAVARDPAARLAGLRVCFIEKMGNRRVASEVQDRLEVLLGMLGRQGAVVQRHEKPMDWGAATMMTMMRGYQRYRLEALAREWGERMDRSLIEAIRHGATLAALDGQRAPADRARLYKSVEALFDEADVLITPTVSAPAPRVDHRHDEPLSIDGEQVGMLREQWYCYTGAFNLTGHPAISIPIGFDARGVPIGAQAVGRWFDEALLIDIAAAVEQAMPWGDRWPGLEGEGGFLPYP